MNVERLHMFSEEIKKLRKMRGFTIEDMANSMNVSRITYAKWENGQTSPKADQIPELASKLGASINQLFGEEVAKNYEKLKGIIKLAEQLTMEDQETLSQIIMALSYKSNVERTQKLKLEAYISEVMNED
ncbi:helix-turn-helix domain-containing protein [Parabacteroides distasonis]|uniref:Helix-turn-helix domain-containing protein n=3 Tax=Bacteria TaxID=2 RepID=A0A7K0GNV5_PARDI|nr:helix-turn-helix transcriptional regulator [Bacteroides stercoris]MRY60585.1 helix-turn-helix domain-containing protein [Parabacteroides distasonis]MTU44607.1 helix-turn-helix domain-containing protein [Parasutterella excrementihominis]